MCDECPIDQRPSTQEAGRTPRRLAQDDKDKAAHMLREQEREQAKNDAIKDRKLALPRYRIKYTCDKCGSKFDQSTKKCEKCGHRKCQTCGRWPPRKPEEPVAAGDGPALESLEDTLAQYALKDEHRVTPRQFVDSGAASMVHDRFSTEKRSFSTNESVGAAAVSPREAKVQGATQETTPPVSKEAFDAKKDTDMTDDANEDLYDCYEYNTK